MLSDPCSKHTRKVQYAGWRLQVKLLLLLFIIIIIIIIIIIYWTKQCLSACASNKVFTNLITLINFIVLQGIKANTKIVSSYIWQKLLIEMPKYYIFETGFQSRLLWCTVYIKSMFLFVFARENVSRSSWSKRGFDVHKFE